MDKEFTSNEAKQIGDALGVDWTQVDLGEFRKGLEVELEHGSQFGDTTNVTGDDFIETARIALAHLFEIPDYYTRLNKMEAEAFRALAMYLF